VELGHLVRQVAPLHLLERYYSRARARGRKNLASDYSPHCRIDPADMGAREFASNAVRDLMRRGHVVAGGARGNRVYRLVKIVSCDPQSADQTRSRKRA